MVELVKERRAYDLLQWVAYSLPSDYDLSLALKNHYTKLQKQRSDYAFDEFCADNRYESGPELKAFRTLHDLGIFTPDVYFSPSRAKDGYYTDELRKCTRVSASTDSPEGQSRRDRKWRARVRLASIDEKCG
jgi:hypothetical protein|tara:strand:+ start:367 stop:762 length:396 start_codon:yes stop_codon:yes gene_type:complete